MFHRKVSCLNRVELLDKKLSIRHLADGSETGAALVSNIAANPMNILHFWLQLRRKAVGFRSWNASRQ
ncbi:hypothetical protein OK016_01705 [Vibrio chagasii]|nr:hypothetical protein [Vibrio chagasii]